MASSVANLPNVSMVGSGLTKTLNVGGSRFGSWSYKAFAPTSYVATTVTNPIAQLSVPPNYLTMSAFGGATPAQQASASASSSSPKSPTFWAIGAIGFLLLMYVLKRKGTVK